MIPPLTQDLLICAIQSDRMVEAGRRYFQQGRVSDLRIDQQYGIASALVRGSGRNHYVTSVIFEDEEEFEAVPGSECSCPVGMGCKHVAALLFALLASGYEDRQGQEPPRLPIKAQDQQAPSIAGPLAQWLDAAVVDDLALQARYEELCFVLEPVALFKQGKRPPKGSSLPLMPERYRLEVRAWRRWPDDAHWRLAQPWEVQQARAILRPQAGRLLSRTTHAVGGAEEF